MAHDDRKLTATVTNPFVRDGAWPCDLISPISLAEKLDDEKLESACDEACGDMNGAQVRDDET